MVDTSLLVLQLLARDSARIFPLCGRSYNQLNHATLSLITEIKPLLNYNTLVSHLILFRKDICRNSYTPCHTLGKAFFIIFLEDFGIFFSVIIYLRMFVSSGLSNMDGMCTSGRECSLNQDTGFTLVYTVAHELGHK